MSATIPAAHAAVVVLLVAVGACGPNRAQREQARAQAAEREQVHELARQAARLAAPDSSPVERSPVERSPVERATIPNRIGLPQIAGVASDSVRITSTDGAVIYTLVRDTVRMQLGDSVVREVRRKVNAGADSAPGNFSAFIKRTVAGAVGSAMSFVMKTPVRDIRSARYENGELRIETGSGLLHRSTINAGSKHGRDRMTFAPDDAERFVAAIEARQRALGVR